MGAELIDFPEVFVGDFSKVFVLVVCVLTGGEGFVCVGTFCRFFAFFGTGGVLVGDPSLSSFDLQWNILCVINSNNTRKNLSLLLSSTVFTLQQTKIMTSPLHNCLDLLNDVVVPDDGGTLIGRE